MRFKFWPTLTFATLLTGVPAAALSGTTLRVEETAWSSLGDEMAVVDFNLVLESDPALRAVEIRVHEPDDPSLHLEIELRSASAGTIVLPVKGMEYLGVRLFALVFPREGPPDGGSLPVGTLRCDMPLAAAGPVVNAVGLLDDGSRVEIPVDHRSTTGRQSPPVAQRLTFSPNPVRSSVEFRYSLRSPGDIELSVFDLAGRKVATVESGARAGGDHRARWTVIDDAGRAVAAGVYFVKLRTTAGTTSEQLLIVR